MNPSHFGDWELDQVDWLVRHGTPRADAERIMRAARDAAMEAARKADDDRQFVIAYREIGPVRLGQMKGRSREAMRKRYVEIIGDSGCQLNLQEKLAS